METKEILDDGTERKLQVVKPNDGISDELVKLLDVAIAKRHSRSEHFPLDLLRLISGYISAIRNYVSVDHELKQTPLQWLPLYNLGHQWITDRVLAISADMTTVAALGAFKRTLTVFRPNGDPNDDSGRLVIQIPTSKPSNIRFGPTNDTLGGGLVHSTGWSQKLLTIEYDDFSMTYQHYVVQFELQPNPQIISTSRFLLADRCPSRSTVVKANGQTLFSSTMRNLTCISTDGQRACVVRCFGTQLKANRIYKTVKYRCSIYERLPTTIDAKEEEAWKWKELKGCELQVPDGWAKYENRLSVHFKGTYNLCITNPHPKRRIKVKRLLPYSDQTQCLVIREADGYTKQELKWFECPSFSVVGVWDDRFHFESDWMLTSNDAVAKLVKPLKGRKAIRVDKVHSTGWSQRRLTKDSKIQKPGHGTPLVPAPLALAPLEPTPQTASKSTPPTRKRVNHEIIAVQANNANGRVHTICKFRKSVLFTAFLPIVGPHKGILALMYDKKLWKVVLLKRQGPLILL